MLKLRKSLIKVSALAMATALTLPLITNQAEAGQNGKSGVKLELEVGSSTVGPINPTDPTDPTDPGDGGTIDPEVDPGLSLNYVANLDFGKNDIESSEKSYFAKNLGINSPFVQVTDNRGVDKEWNLKVKADQFKVGTTPTLDGAYFTFKDGTGVAANAGTIIGSGAAPTINNNVVIPTNSTEINVADATNQAARGTWLVRWVDNGGVGTDKQILSGGNTTTEKRNDLVKITIPAGKGSAGTHLTTITWTLSDTP